MPLVRDRQSISGSAASAAASQGSLAALLAELMAVGASGRVYYVDPTLGDDTGPGTNREQAWKTVAKVNATSFQPGDTVLFAKGRVWTDAPLMPKVAGTVQLPITFGSYTPLGGATSDAKPIFRGLDDIKALTWGLSAIVATFPVTAVGAANPATITVGGGHGTLAVGSFIIPHGLGGTVQANDNTYKITALGGTGSNTLTLADKDGTAIDGTGWSAWTSGGTIQLAAYQGAMPMKAAFQVKGNTVNFRTAGPSGGGGGFPTDDCDAHRLVMSIGCSAANAGDLFTALHLPHNLENGMGPFYLTGTLPAGTTALTKYWICSSGLTQTGQTTFQLSTTEAGAKAYPTPANVVVLTGDSASVSLVSIDGSPIRIKNNNMALVALAYTGRSAIFHNARILKGTTSGACAKVYGHRDLGGSAGILYLWAISPGAAGLFSNGETITEYTAPAPPSNPVAGSTATVSGTLFNCLGQVANSIFLTGGDTLRKHYIEGGGDVAFNPDGGVDYSGAGGFTVGQTVTGPTNNPWTGVITAHYPNGDGTGGTVFITSSNNRQGGAGDTFTDPLGGTGQVTGGYRRFLNYSGRSAAFHVGGQVTAPSGAKCLVLGDTDLGGNTGRLWVKPFNTSVNDFVGSEALTEVQGGAATVAAQPSGGAYFVFFHWYRTHGSPSADTNLSAMLVTARLGAVIPDRAFVRFRDLFFDGGQHAAWLGSQESSVVVEGLWFDGCDIAWSQVNGLELHNTKNSLFWRGEYHHNGYKCDGETAGQDSNAGSDISSRDGSTLNVFAFLDLHHAGEDGAQMYRSNGFANEFHFVWAHDNQENGLDCKNEEVRSFDSHFSHVDNVTVTVQYPNASDNTALTFVVMYRTIVEQMSQGTGAGNCLRSAELCKAIYLFACRVITHGAGAGASSMISIAGGAGNYATGDALRFAFKAWNTEFIAIEYTGSGAGITLFNISSPDTIAITAVSIGAAAQITNSGTNGLVTGDQLVWIFGLTGTAGTALLNGKQWIATKVDNTHFNLKDPATGLAVDTTGLTTGTGTAVADVQVLNVGLYGCTIITNQKKTGIVTNNNWPGLLEIYDTCWMLQGASSTAADGRALQLGNSIAAARVGWSNNNYWRTSGPTTDSLLSVLSVDYAQAAIGTLVAGINGRVGGTNAISVNPQFTKTTVPVDLRPVLASALGGAGVTRSDLANDNGGAVRASPPTIGAWERKAA